MNKNGYAIELTEHPCSKRMYTGKTYIVHGKKYAVLSVDKMKVYTSRKRAENAMIALVNSTENVNECKICHVNVLD